MAVLTKSESCLRWAVLFLGCICLITNYYCYDNPSALMTQLEESTGMDDDMFALTYSVYSLPNMVLPFFGGYCCDRFGAARCLIVFAILLTAGQALFAFGVSVSSVPLILMGRVGFGLGGENMTVALSTLLADWFRGKEMAFAMGLFVALARLGSVFNNFASPPIANATSVSTAIWFGAVLCAAGVGCSILILSSERFVLATIARGRLPPDASASGDGTSSAGTRDGALEDASGAGRGSSGKTTSSSIQGGGAGAGGTITASEGGDGLASPLGLPLIATDSAKLPHAGGGRQFALRRFKASFWMLTASCLAIYGCVLPFNNVASRVLMERDYFRPNPDGCALTYPTRCQSADNPPDAASGLCPSNRTAGSYAPPLPINATAGNVTIGNATSPLAPASVVCTNPDWAAKGACTQDYCAALHAAEAKATHQMSIPYMISAIASPFLGFAIDRLGGRALIAALCPIVLIAVHLALAYDRSMGPTVPLVGQGVAYSVFAAALWPSVPLTVPSEYEGLAYGVVTALQNSGLGAFPLLVSFVYDQAGKRYLPGTELLFAGFAAVGLASGLMLSVYDATHGHKLNRA